jgi:four helix bundle protein
MSEESVKSFEGLLCWQACRTLRLFVTQEIIPLLPKEEKYRLADQLYRSARSTTANIAEGYGRFHYLDNSRFCTQARGSCWEILDHTITAFDEKLINEITLSKTRELVSNANRILNGYSITSKVPPRKNRLILNRITHNR